MATIDNTPFYIALTAWGTWALVGCAFYTVWRQVRAQRQLVAIQFLLQIEREFNSPFMAGKRSYLAQALLASRIPPQPRDETVLEFFETLGHLTRRGFLDQELVWSIFSYAARTYWYAAEDYILSGRNECGDTSLFANMEWLDGFLTDYEAKYRKKSRADIKISPDFRDSFLRDEVLLGSTVEATHTREKEGAI